MELYKAETPSMITECLECGKEIITRDMRKPSKFCSLMCESNYRYRMRRMDPMTGRIPSPEDARKI